MYKVLWMHREGGKYLPGGTENLLEVTSELGLEIRSLMSNPEAPVNTRADSVGTRHPKAE